MLQNILTNSFLAAALLVAATFSTTVQQHFPSAIYVQNLVIDAWVLLAPGGKLHPTDFIESKGHLVVEGFLLVVISYLLFQGAYKPSKRQERPLTDKEIDELCEEWQPEPLGGALTPAQTVQLQTPVVSGEAGTRVTVNGRPALNMTSLNFLGLAGREDVKQRCAATIEKYGVGACGPRGFYGTIDVHLELEERLARFMGSQEAILYSYDLATLPSVIPAFANKKDLIICDEGVNYGIQNGCHLSRARVLYFKHNDVEDLERVLQQVVKEDKKHRKPLNRRFIVVEGIYVNYGDVAPLGRIKELKERYKYRLMVDESMSLGVMGPRGRGACEHFGFTPDDVEFVGASLGNSLAAVGGFCSGDREIVDHQRLSGLGYCFSAALPPFLATAAIATLDHLESSGGELMAAVQRNATLFRKAAAALPGLCVVGGSQGEAAISPVVHLALDPAPPREKFAEGDALLQRLVDDCLTREEVLFSVSKYSCLERSRPQPSIRVAVTAAHTAKEIEAAVAALKACCRRVLR